MKKSMFLFYFSITLAIASSALYHFSAKSTPANVNFSVSLVVTYAVAIIITILIAFFFPSRNGLILELKQLNWASFLLAIAIVGIEFGFLLGLPLWLEPGYCCSAGQRGSLADPCPGGDFCIQG